VFRGVISHVATADSTEVLYQRAFAAHWSDVFRFALAWTNDWAAAEDLAQDAYLRLWNERGRLDWNRAVLPWLLVATRRLATDRFRGLRRRMVAASRPADLDPSTHARWLDVKAALDRLTATERSALILTAIEGATYDEAARLLGTSAGALRAAVSRARTKLENA
jgi:RNA polymerase sigma-70 factor, ECF subfamily